MTSISGKTDIDWDAFAHALAPVEIIDEPVLVKKRSRDFYNMRFGGHPVLLPEAKIYIRNSFLRSICYPR